VANQISFIWDIFVSSFRYSDDVSNQRF